MLIATGDRWHAAASILAAEAGKDVYSEKPCAITIELARRLGRFHPSHRPRVPGGHAAAQHLELHARRPMAQTGRLGNLRTLHASIYQLQDRHDWLPAQPEPPKDVIDWDMWLGPAPWRPYNRHTSTAAGAATTISIPAPRCWTGAPTRSISARWAARADDTVPTTYEPLQVPGDNVIACRYANGMKLVLRRNGWIGLGTCPVRFEGDEGWVETGDSGQIDGLD